MITLYSTHCPNCKMLEKKLEQAGITFNLIDCMDEVLEKAKEVGMKSAPFIIKDGTVYNLSDSLKLIKEF